MKIKNDNCLLTTAFGIRTISRAKFIGARRDRAANCQGYKRYVNNFFHRIN